MSHRNRKEARRDRPRRLTLQQLSERRLMAADVSLHDGVLEIDSDGASDQVVIRNSLRYVNGPIGGFRIPRMFVQVTATDLTNGGTQTYEFNRSQVDHVDANMRSGDDILDARGTDFPIIAFGGRGDDRLYGGNRNDILHGERDDDRLYGYGGDDLLFGNSGDDRLYGHDGDDVLRGSFGVDRLYGHAGEDELMGDWGSDYLYGGDNDDVLRGGTERDYLRGENGNDRLLGGNGNDDLSGGDGHDGLIGGAGSDTMAGGRGVDRFLTNTHEFDVMEDLRSWDAEIRFLRSTEEFVGLGGSNLGWFTVTPKSWSQDEVEKVDKGLEMLFNITGNDSLLEKHDGRVIEFQRYGDLLVDGVERNDFLGFNGGRIRMLNNAFERGEMSVIQTTIHEVGHYFDEPGENSFVNQFRTSGGWTERFWFWESKTGLTQADDNNWGSWYYPTDRADEFARTYGQMNPLEDWATSFTAKVMTDNGVQYRGEDIQDTRDRMIARFNVIDDFFASIS